MRSKVTYKVTYLLTCPPDQAGRSEIGKIFKISSACLHLPLTHFLSLSLTRYPTRSEMSSDSLIYGFSTKTMGLMAFNFVSAVGIVFMNKYVFHTFSYNYAVFVTSLHFVMTTIGVRCCHMAGMYQPKELKHMDVLPITVAFCLFVVCNNLSLQYNSVGFYQLMKVLTTPVVVGACNLSLHGVTESCRLCRTSTALA